MKPVAMFAGAAVALTISAHSAPAQYSANPQTPSSQSAATISARLIDPQKKAMQQAATVEVSVTGVELVDPARTGEVPASSQAHLHYQVDNGPTVATTATKLSFHGLTAGTHTIRVMLADNAHNPLGPQQTLNVMIGAQSTSTSGQQPHAAQPQPTSQTQPPVTTTPTLPGATTTQAATSTIVGCVYRERDVPGRTPNVAEQAGILEDYILAEVRTSGQQTTSPTGSTAGATGTAGSTAGAMYKLEHVADERLRPLVGKRVEVTGRIDAEPGDTASRPAATTGTRTTQPDKSLGPDWIELPEFEVRSIREIAGTCPATPTMPRQ